ncbi:MAG: hypothetical protein SAJ12_00450 [Jaaginema sp. PMC 1079.18]|nr:hypothetical protein [Jaaginema sp. PMC 1080.18]MEC4849453.1 hypothetical protein [Jaaginema sp. PMC 1079.18]MEC4865448.1 hypothetical protein [Jaaginema sp. PMC 1078.18]
MSSEKTASLLVGWAIFSLFSLGKAIAQTQDLPIYVPHSISSDALPSVSNNRQGYEYLQNGVERDRLFEEALQ